MSNLTCIASNQSFGGWHKRFTHASSSNYCTMHFAIYLPPQAAVEGAQLPVIYWLSGLTCTDENFMQKAGAQRIAAELGVVIVAPDTSPRGEGVPDDPNGAYDLGWGAGFYVNATQEPWSKHYQMYDYVAHELPELIEREFPVSQQRAITGHSMGGHGALTVALKNPERYSSVSAFAPISNPMQSPRGRNALNAYLGSDEETWMQYDSCELVKKSLSKDALPLLVDQGDDDEFYPEGLLTQNLIQVTEKKHYPANIRMQRGYDHSYYFVASFIEEHLRFHVKHFEL